MNEKREPGLYEPGTSNMIMSFQALINEGYLEYENHSLFSLIIKDFKQMSGDLVLPDSIEKLSRYNPNVYIYLDSVILPENLKIIADYTFSKFRKFEDINIPDNVETIGKHAFQYCASLKKIILPSKLKDIGECAFKECMSLKEIKLPDTLKVLPKRIFKKCSSLENINLPSSLEIIDDWAFEECSKLTYIKIPDGVIEIRDGVFNECYNLAKVDLPKSLTVINTLVFGDCQCLNDINLTNVSEIGDYAFSGCSSLKKMILPENLQSMYANSFDGCKNLESITLPRTFKKIIFKKSVVDLPVFLCCSALKKIIYLGDNSDVIKMLKRLKEQSYNKNFKLVFPNKGLFNKKSKVKENTKLQIKTQSHDAITTSLLDIISEIKNKINNIGDDTVKSIFENKLSSILNDYNKYIDKVQNNDGLIFDERSKYIKKLNELSINLNFTNFCIKIFNFEKSLENKDVPTLDIIKSIFELFGGLDDNDKEIYKNKLSEIIHKYQRDILDEQENNEVGIKVLNIELLEKDLNQELRLFILNLREYLVIYDNVYFNYLRSIGIDTNELIMEYKNILTMDNSSENVILYFQKVKKLIDNTNFDLLINVDVDLSKIKNITYNPVVQLFIAIRQSMEEDNLSAPKKDECLNLMKNYLIDLKEENKEALPISKQIAKVFADSEIKKARTREKLNYEKL